MEALIFLLVILLIATLVVIPIILLNKLSSSNRTIDNLSKEVKELDNKLLFVVNNLATKYDVKQILAAISNLEDKKAAPQTTETVLTEEEKITEEIVSPAVEESIVESVELMQPVVESIVEVVEETIVPAEQTIVHEEIKEPEVVEEEVTAAYAAIKAKTIEERTVTTPPIAVPSFAEEDEEREPEKGIIEKLFGGNLLAKIGIVTLVLGVGFFVKYAIDQGWINEMGRVAIGLVTGAIIIAVAHKLKERYNVFSSILVGGGISVFYVTITLAFREYEIFSQPVAFVLLIMVTVFSVALSLLYNRQELAIFSLLGGVLAPLMVSTNQGNYIVLFSYMLILNTGMLIISLKKNWHLVGIIAYVCSLLFYVTWLLVKFEDQYLGATIFASLFFIQFYILAIIKHFREGKKMTLFQAVLILTNNLFVLFAGMYIFYDYVPDLRGIATIVIAVANAIVMLTLFRQSKVDKNMIYLIIAVVMSFVSLAVPIQLRGYVITMFWAAESVLLLWLWQKSKINVFRLGFLVISILAIISYAMDVELNYGNAWELSMFSNRIFITGIVLLISYGINLFLLSKENQDEYLSINGSNLFTMGALKMLFKFLFVILLFLVFYLELNHQLEVYADDGYNLSYKDLFLATYTTLFVAGLAIVSRNKMNLWKYWFFLFSTVLYAFVYTRMTGNLADDIFGAQVYAKSYFLIHFLSLPAIGYVVYLLAKNIKMMGQGKFKVLCWVLVVLSVIILSVELDNVVLTLFGDGNNYYSLLHDVHTFGYPILWALVALILMRWGLKNREVVLRQISLISFGLIIAKFYIYDVWRMSQAGLIVSFVLLGVILLVVSFMQQKIKDWAKKDEEIRDEEED